MYLSINGIDFLKLWSGVSSAFDCVLPKQQGNLFHRFGQLLVRYLENASLVFWLYNDCKYLLLYIGSRYE